MLPNIFLDFLNKSSLSDLDFLPPSNEAAIKNLLLPSSVVDKFMTIAKNGAGCLLCLWKNGDDIVLDEDLPVVWIDSEGFPKSVFAPNIASAVSLFPYGSGFVYDVISAWEYHLQDSKSYKIPTKRFTKRTVKSYLKDATQFEEDYQRLLQFNAQHGIETCPDPVALIGNAIQTFPKLSEWLKEQKT